MQTGARPLTVFLLLIVSLVVPAAAVRAAEAHHFRVRVGLYQLGFPQSMTIAPSNGVLEIFDPIQKRAVYSGGCPEITLTAIPGGVAAWKGKTLLVRSAKPLLVSAVGRPPSHLEVRTTLAGPAVQTTADSHRKISHRAYRGSLAIAPWKGRLFAVNVVDLEEYLKSVVPAEMGDQAPAASFEAQAIAARTYALRNLKRHADSGFDLCDRVHCQVYPGMLQEIPAATQAVQRTFGEVLLHDGQFANTVYHARCGGKLASSQGVWGGKAVPYLPAHDDSLGQGGFFCNLSAEEVKEGVARLDAQRPGRATAVPRHRRFLRPARGHRVGMCQDGAIGMGLAGYQKPAILGFYYPGTSLALMRYARGLPPPPADPAPAPTLARRGPATTPGVTTPGVTVPAGPSLRQTITEIARTNPGLGATPPAGFNKWFWSALPPRKSPREAFPPDAARVQRPMPTSPRKEG